MRKLNLFAAVVAAVSLLFIGCQNDTSDDSGYYFSTISETSAQFAIEFPEEDPTILSWTDIQKVSGVQSKDQLEIFIVPMGFKSIGVQAFSDCISLIAVLILPQIESIGAEAFDGCEKLEMINIPASVTVIGRGAFKGCTALTDIGFEDTESKWVEDEKTPGGFSTVRDGLSSDDVAEAIRTKDTSKLRYRKLQ